MTADRPDHVLAVDRYALGEERAAGRLATRERLDLLAGVGGEREHDRPLSRKRPWVLRRLRREAQLAGDWGVRVRRNVHAAQRKVWTMVQSQGMRIGEVASRSGVSVDTVRFYERVGVLPTPAREETSGYRIYDASTIDRILLTRALQRIGFTLEDAVGALAAHDAGDATCESERWRLQAVLERVDAKLEELRQLKTRIADAQRACDQGRCLLTSARPPGSP